MKYSVALVSIQGISPLSQSRALPPKSDQESHDAYDLRMWRQKAHARPDGRITIPAHGIHQMLIAAAAYRGETIKGAGRKTWKGKFERGLALLSDALTDRTIDDAQPITLSVSSTGRRGLGPRVSRTFPIWYEWSAEFEVMILDPLLTEDVFRRHLETAGIFIGLGRFRPEVGGMNGRFRVTEIAWQDNRQLAA